MCVVIGLAIELQVVWSYYSGYIVEVVSIICILVVIVSFVVVLDALNGDQVVFVIMHGFD